MWSFGFVNPLRTLGSHRGALWRRARCAFLALVWIFAGDWGICQTIWTGSEITFTKPGFADWTQDGFQDEVTANVSLTRADTRGLFNAAVEDFYKSGSPADTEWAFGSISNWSELSYSTWEQWHGKNPPSAIGREAVVHLISEDIYLGITIDSWSIGAAGGGGFSYTRTSGPVDPCEFEANAVEVEIRDAGFSPAGIAVAPNGEILFADSLNHRIQVFDSAGTFLRGFGSLGSDEGEFNSPFGVAATEFGEIVVADSGNGRIQIFDSEGTFLREFGSASSSGEALSNVGEPVDGSMGPLIQRFGLVGGAPQQTISPRGIAPPVAVDGELDYPHAVSVGPSGEIVVVDDGTASLQVFDSEGNFLRHVGRFGVADGEFISPTSVGVSASGEIVVADRGANRIQIFDAAGGFLRKFGSEGSENGQFDGPFGVSVSLSGEIVVADTGNHRIQVLDLMGGFVRKFGSVGAEAGQINEPSGVIVSPNGRILVADSRNDRISSWTSCLCRSGSGDIDCSGQVNILDALAARDHALGARELSATELSSGDMNGDGSVSEADVEAIILRALGDE